MAEQNPIARTWLVAGLLTLTGATGLIDSVSFLRLGHVFVANMTGNVVFIGFALDPHSGVSATASLLAVAGFGAGGALGGRLGGWLDDRPRRWPAGALGGEAALLAVIAGLVAAGALPIGGTARLPTIVALAICFGLQNATVRGLAVRDLTTTVLTSTLTGLITDSVLGGGTHEHLSRRLGAVLAMAAGAGAGALLQEISPALTIGVGAVVVATVATMLAAAPSAQVSD